MNETFIYSQGLIYNRPGLLNASDSGYPWLADSWPATSLPVNSGSGGPNDLNNFGRGDVMPSAQADKTGTMLSDGAIYSSIDFTTKGGFGSPSPASQPRPTPHQILHSNSIHAAGRRSARGPVEDLPTGQAG
ncbi:hypothetical protein cypCar_00033697 [Cyprinus carpio]|nr:hypothetical protein cypCar_00033697 [Cyprinus carpio]